MNIFKLNITPSSDGRTLVYNTKIKSYGNLWTTIFTGKVYALPNQSEVKIDLQDILWNYKFDGRNYFAPQLNSTGDDYVMCTTYTTLDNYWYNQVMVEIPELNVSVTKNVKFFNYNLFNQPILDVEDNTVALFMDEYVVSHLPVNLPSNFYFRQLVWNGSFLKGIDGNTSVEQRAKLGQITFAGGSKSYSLNGKTIAVIDQCPKPYYLVFLTPSGGMEVVPFNKYSEVDIEYNNNELVGMDNYRWNFNKNLQSEWKLKSKNLSDKEYKVYSNIFQSKYLLLFDMENGRQHFVNVVDDNYRQKINKPNERPIYFEITVRAAEVKII